MKHETSRRKHGFKVNTLHKRKEPHVLKYLGEKASFWIATMSLFAFVIGNMVGQHGWYAFWKSVMGKGDDSLIVYTGTVHPLPKLVDYECWGKYGGDPKSHSFGQVPDQCKIPPPKYDAAHQHMLISMAYMSSYQKGSEGSGWHSGVDYRTPNGTPTVAAANGIVERVDENSGYGKYIVIKVPNAPDPDDPHNKKTELYLAYAHLSAVYVRVGDIVNKGEQIGLTGNSGSSTGYHLHFQIDRASAPWHPYWPSALFSNTKRQQLAYRYTVNPMPYIAANYNPITEPG